jgi:hypothetical protein
MRPFYVVCGDFQLSTFNFQLKDVFLRGKTKIEKDGSNRC